MDYYTWTLVTGLVTWSLLCYFSCKMPYPAHLIATRLPYSLVELHVTEQCHKSFSRHRYSQGKIGVLM